MGRRENSMKEEEKILERVEQIVDGYDCRRESLIAIMQDEGL